jgi:hypothetical protein
MSHDTRITDDMRLCIEECLGCHRVCLETVNHCFSLGGKHAIPRHIGLLLDCAQICSTSADFMLRGSEFHPRTCGVCAELCAACADSCQEIGPRDAIMQRCVEACRRCGDSCRRMAGLSA